MSKSDRLISIVRRNEELIGLFTRPKCDFYISLKNPRSRWNLTFEEMADFYEFVETPLKDKFTSVSSCSGKYPAEFKRYLLPSFSEESPAIIRQYLHFFWSLELQKNRNLLTAVSRLASFKNHESAFAWLKVIERQLANRRSVFVAILLESGAFEMPITNIDFRIFDHLEKMKQRRDYMMRVRFLMRCIVKRISSQHILKMLELASPQWIFWEPYDVYSFPEKPAKKLIRYVHTAGGCSHHIGIHLWELCVKLKGFKHFLQHTNFRTEKPKIVLRYLRVLTCFAVWQGRCDENIFELWPYIQPTALYVWARLSKIEESFKQRYLEFFEEFFDFWNEELLKNFALDYFKIIEKFIPIKVKYANQVSSIAELLAKAAHPLTDAFVHAPESSWTQFQKSCEAGDSDKWDVGLVEMLNAQRLFTIKAFHYFPKKLFEVASQITSLRDGRRRQVLCEFQRHPLMAEQFGKKSNLEIVSYFKGHRELINPVPKKFQELAGIAGALSKQRILRYRKEFHKNLNLSRLQLLADIIDQNLVRPFAPNAFKQEIRHAFQILGGTEVNRRAVRRFLRAYFKGDQGYLQNHPLTKNWIQSHSFFDPVLWTSGIRLERNCDELGSVSIVVEQNPFEVWKLGTYVQSCLAQGGMNQQYAAAVMLDFNKRVVYMRDRNERVIGRQMLAISEEKRLVCFCVYPVKATRAMKEMFREYDMQFAQALGLPIHTDRQEPYTIRRILSEGWYNDGAWNLKC